MKNRVGFAKKTLAEVPLDSQVVLVRVDYNVPLNDQGAIDDDYRIRMSLPTIRALTERGCRVVLCAHLGRPEGKPEPAYSLEPVAGRLVELLGEPVKFVSDCVGDKVVQAVKRLRGGEVLLLENLRFHAGEEANDTGFARQLADDTQARYFVQDGFGVVHRAHASTAAITERLPSVAGLLLEREVRAIKSAMEAPKRPLVALLGGAKISDKIGVVEAFAKRADTVVIGGAMANTFLKYQGKPIGASLVEDGLDDIIKQAYAATDNQPDKLLLPEDVAVGRSTEESEPRRETSLDEVSDDDKILDIGPKTIEKMAEVIRSAGTVVWNGPLGYAERRQFAHGSARAALELATHPDIISVIGGGDTADFVLDWDARGGDSFHHISTGGGASLELMAGSPMPGIDALLDA